MRVGFSVHSSQTLSSVYYKGYCMIYYLFIVQNFLSVVVHTTGQTLLNVTKRFGILQVACLKAMPLPVIAVELIGSLFSIKLTYGKHCKAIIIIITLLQECVSFYFWTPADVPRALGSAGFCSLGAVFHDLVHPIFVNLWQSRHIPALLSIFFSVFLFCPINF